MDLLNQLENIVQNLLERLVELEATNEDAARITSRCQELEAENKNILETLELERRNHKAVLQRVDALLTKLKTVRASGSD